MFLASLAHSLARLNPCQNLNQQNEQLEFAISKLIKQLRCAVSHKLVNLLSGML